MPIEEPVLAGVSWVSRLIRLFQEGGNGGGKFSTKAFLVFWILVLVLIWGNALLFPWLQKRGYLGFKYRKLNQNPIAKVVVVVFGFIQLCVVIVISLKVAVSEWE